MKTSRIISLALCIVMLLSTLSFFGVTADTEETTILACSDFQAKSGGSAGMINIKNILSAIKADGIKSVNGFFCCGDYDIDTYGELDCTKEGIRYIKLALKGFVKEDDMVFVQGNHDVYPCQESGLSPSGNNDSDAYGVYVIHEEDYMWYNNDETRIKKTAQKLINYLNEKLASGYDKPIFVLSHLPLHYSMRTIVDGDAKYASYIFNALNDAAQKGLNIVFMYGHDHANGWDDYLGGASVYLKKGDKIQIAKNSAHQKEYKTLSFTYMNAGYIGYYNNHNGADDALTMTVFKIKNGEVTVSRYSKDGLHDLKSEGVTNDYRNEKGYSPDKNVYASGEKIVLTKVSDKTPLPELIKITTSGMRFNRVESVEALASGKKYVLVHNASPDHIMIPTVVTKSDSSGGKRTGLNVIRTEEFGDVAAFGDFKAYEWTLTQACGGWYLGSDEGNVLFTSTADQKITATFDSVGSIFNIKGTTGAFVFETGSNSLNYNARGLINGFSSDPAKFYIYEYAGYSVEVENGRAHADSSPISSAHPGQEITVVALDDTDGMKFDSWEIIKGEITFSDPGAREQTFKMPEGEVSIVARYKEISTVTDPTQNGDTQPDATVEAYKDSDKAAVIISIVAVSGAVFAVAVYIIVKKARHKA